MWEEGCVARCDASYARTFRSSTRRPWATCLLRCQSSVSRAACDEHNRTLGSCACDAHLAPACHQAAPPPAPSHHSRHRRCHTRLTPHAPHTPRACSSLRYSAPSYGASSHVGDRLYHGASSSHVRDLPCKGPTAHHPMVHDAPAPRCAASPPRSHAAAWLHPGPHSLRTTGGREGRGEWAVST